VSEAAELVSLFFQVKAINPTWSDNQVFAEVKTRLRQAREWLGTVDRSEL
jgi:hypothetical protein